MTTINQTFETNGFFKDYYFNGKYVGSIHLDEADRETYGYYGRREEILTEPVKLKNKTLKAGQKVKTELQVSCGRTIEDFSFMK